MNRYLSLLLVLVALASQAHAGKLYMSATIAQYPTANAATQDVMQSPNTLGGTCVKYTPPAVGSVTTAYFPAFYPIDADASVGAKPFNATAQFHKVGTGATASQVCFVVQLGISRAGAAPATTSYSPDNYIFGRMDNLRYNGVFNYIAQDSGVAQNQVFAASTTGNLLGVPWTTQCLNPGDPYACCTQVSPETGCTIQSAVADAPILFKVERRHTITSPSACTDGSSESYCLDYLTITY